MKAVRLLGLVVISSVFGINTSYAHKAHEATISADHCWIRLMPGTAPSGGFFKANNNTSQDQTIKSVKSADFGMIMMHETKLVDGVSKMSMVHDITIAANQSLDFKSGGYHLMLDKPRAGLNVGDSVKLEFELANGTSFATECAVKAPADLSGMHHGSH